MVDTGRIRFSLRIKLLGSMIASLFLVIVFLNYLAIFLFTEDKQAYVYQTQTSQSTLAGKEFVTLIKHSLGLLKVALGEIDPTHAPSPQEQARLRALLQNQSELASIRFLTFDPKTKDAVSTFSLIRPELPAGEFSDEALLKQEQRGKSLLAELAPKLFARSYAVANLTRIGREPALGVVLADLRNAQADKPVPIAIGVLPLRDFSRGITEGGLTISTSEGMVLFDSDPSKLYGINDLMDDPLFSASISQTAANGAIQFERESDQYLGTFVRPGFDLVVLNRIPWKKAMRATYDLTIKFILLATMALCLTTIYALLFSRTLTAPLRELYSGAKEIETGKFDLNLKVQSNDEIGALTGAFNQMSKKIGELLDESVAKARLEKDLEAASSVQYALIPESAHDSQNFRIRSYYQPAAQCGGDWWGFFENQDELWLMIADATGHGFPSALITASARGCFSVLERLISTNPAFSFSVVDLLKIANQVVFDASRGQLQMTFFIVKVDFSTQKLSYASAGHDPPWLFTKTAQGFNQQSLMMPSTRLGEGQELPDLEALEVSFNPGDVLFFYTDGLREASNPEGEFFGRKRMMQILRQNVAKGADAAVSQLCKEFSDFRRGKPLDDDVTMVVAQLLPHSRELNHA